MKTICCALAAIVCAGSASAFAPSLRIGGDGWILETFGTDVAVLRAPVSQSQQSASGVGVLLSCSGSDRRARFTFPIPIVGSPLPADGGSVLFTQAGKPGGHKTAIARFDLADAATMVLSDAASSQDELIRSLGQIILERPAGLDILVHLGTGPVAFMRVVPYRLFLSLDALDALSVRRFLAVCDHAMPDDAG